jgi:ABC-type lipoprotein export system ATPase subunit
MLLQLQKITKGYGETGSHSYRSVLTETDLIVGKGEKIAIVGPSSSGKTTLLNLIGTLDHPEKGKVFFNGKDITGYSGTELANFRNENIGFIFQFHHLMPQLTLLENVMLPLLPRGNTALQEQKEWAEYLVQKVGVWEQRNQKPSQLSGGECQRTAVVRALVNKPQLILADEPTGALDEENAVTLTNVMLKLSEEEGVSLITVTHAASLADKMDKKYTLRNGKLI